MEFKLSKNDISALHRAILLDTEVDIRKKVIQIVSEQSGFDNATINSSTRLIEDLLLDELDYIEIIMQIEDEFGISIPDDEESELRNNFSIHELCKLIVNKKIKKS